MKIAVLILAAGPSWRGWTKEAPKQLALIEGKPLIVRTLDQLKERGYDDNVMVVTHNEAIQAVVPRYYIPSKHQFWHETLVYTRELWGDRTIILNGDTIYSPEVIDMILADQTSLMFYGKLNGKMSHMNGMAFDKTENERVVNAAKKATRETRIKSEARIKLSWGMYHVLFGLPLRTRNAPCDVWMAQAADDYTCDIDKPEFYAKFLEKHEWAR